MARPEGGRDAESDGEGKKQTLVSELSGDMQRKLLLCMSWPLMGVISTLFRHPSAPGPPAPSLLVPMGAGTVILRQKTRLIHLFGGFPKLA